MAARTQVGPPTRLLPGDDVAEYGDDLAPMPESGRIRVNWTAIGAISTVLLTVLGLVAGGVIWITGTVADVRAEIRPTVKEHIEPVHDSVKELTDKFDQFRDEYSNNRIDHLEKHHMEDDSG